MLSQCFDKGGNLIQEEFNCLANRFKGVIYSYARRYYLPGGDIDDLCQWGMLGLYKAVLNYEEELVYNFETIAVMNIRNMMRSAIKTANRNKHKPANAAISLDHNNDDPSHVNLKLIDRLVVGQDQSDPYYILEEKEAIAKIIYLMERHLSFNEHQVFKLYIVGYKQKHISETLNVDPKIVDNAIQRARKKLNRYSILFK